MNTRVSHVKRCLSPVISRFGEFGMVHWIIIWTSLSPGNFNNQQRIGYLEDTKAKTLKLIVDHWMLGLDLLTVTYHSKSSTKETSLMNEGSNCGVYIVVKRRWVVMDFQMKLKDHEPLISLQQQRLQYLPRIFQQSMVYPSSSVVLSGIKELTAMWSDTISQHTILGGGSLNSQAHSKDFFANETRLTLM